MELESLNRGKEGGGEGGDGGGGQGEVRKGGLGGGEIYSLHIYIHFLTLSSVQRKIGTLNHWHILGLLL